MFFFFSENTKEKHKDCARAREIYHKHSHVEQKILIYFHTLLFLWNNCRNWHQMRGAKWLNFAMYNFHFTLHNAILKLRFKFLNHLNSFQCATCFIQKGSRGNLQSLSTELFRPPYFFRIILNEADALLPTKNLVLFTIYRRNGMQLM